MKTCQWIATVIVLSGVIAAEAKDSVIHLDETFEKQSIGPLTALAPLVRVQQVSVVDGGGKVGEGNVAHFNDSSITEGGWMEYNLGNRDLSSMFIEFDLLNNAPGSGSNKMPIIFGVGPWNTSKDLVLNANAKRAFGLEFYQAGSYMNFTSRVGRHPAERNTYDLTVPQHVKIWVNDHDQNTLSYIRPDTGIEVMIQPDSFVIWINDKLIGAEYGFGMHKDVTVGNTTVGRVGFSSSSTKTVDFLIDNLRVVDPTGESAPMPAGAARKPVTEEITLASMAGATTLQYRPGKDAMNLFVYRPDGWKTGDVRSAMIYFFGGGWTKGTPLKSASWARWAAEHGMVGIAPDYRTKNRFGTSPLSSVADGRAAFNWVVEHADTLGIDPQRIVVGGSSAGGHVALWTAIHTTPPGSSDNESPKVKPAALFLSSAVTDTSALTGYTPHRFGDNAEALSPVHQLDEAMPPILMFHACDDELVDYSTAVALYNKMKSSGNECELISVPQGGHGFSSGYPEWKAKVRVKLEEFLRTQALLSSP